VLWLWLRESPVVRQEFSNPANGMGGNAREDIFEPGEGVDTLARWQEATKLRSTAAVLPPWSLPKNIQLFRPVLFSIRTLCRCRFHQRESHRLLFLEPFAPNVEGLFGKPLFFTKLLH
jgi:hypothetical protein